MESQRLHFTKVFPLPTPIFKELSYCGTSHNHFKERKRKDNAFWANIRNNPRLVQCRSCYITLEQRHILKSLSTCNPDLNRSRGCASKRLELLKCSGEGWAQHSSPTRNSSGSKASAMQWDNLQTQTFLSYLSVKPGSRALGEREEGDAQ